MSEHQNRPLRHNRIGILGLGGYESDPARLARVLGYFRQHDAETVLAPEPEQRHLRFAGDEAARLAALKSLLIDPDIDIIMALRGGYGLTRLLDQFDFDAIAQSIRSGKRFVGHSDFTAFHLGLLARTGAVSYAGPMAGYDFGVDPAIQPVSAFTETHFWTMMNQGRDTVEFQTQFDAPLNAEGTLWGGNLAMLCSLIGTPWMPQVQGGILFLEDVNEHPYRIERLLLQLHHAGILKQQQAILLGDFSGYRLSDYDNGYSFDSMLAYLRGVIPQPLLTGLPFGHCRDKLTLPVGGKGVLKVANGRCQLSMTA